MKPADTIFINDNVIDFAFTNGFARRNERNGLGTSILKLDLEHEVGPFCCFITWLL